METRLTAKNNTFILARTSSRIKEDARVNIGTSEWDISQGDNLSKYCSYCTKSEHVQERCRILKKDNKVVKRLEKMWRRWMTNWILYKRNLNAFHEAKFEPCNQYKEKEKR